MRALKRLEAILFLLVCMVLSIVQVIQVICAVNIGGSGDFSIKFETIENEDDILSVYQPVNSDDPAWTKYGRNATLSAAATKIETKNVTALQQALTNKDSNGNADLTKIKSGLTYGVDDYTNASTPVYGKIDIVNVDIQTGEIIGKLSDPNYKFEWFGRDVTLPAGTTLASGRTLTAETTFTVDVYTYYPTMYIRRCIVDEKQWLSVSERNFLGAVKVPEFYTATFTATLYNPDKSIAKVNNKVVPRSYISDHGPLGYYKSAYLNKNYATSSTDYLVTDYTMNMTTQEEMLNWCSNLTQAWGTNATGLTKYQCAKSCQGEGYTSFVYSYLYLIKYANNNSQIMVGNGNSSSWNKYNAITNKNGAADSAGNNEVLSVTIDGVTISYGKRVELASSVYCTASTVNYLESVKSGGTIGMTVASSSGGNEAGLLYGYKSGYTNTTNNGLTEKTGLYTPQFLTKTSNGRRVLLDGYVGSNGYTSVMCLGISDPWGGIFTWMFGMVVLNNTDDPNRGDSASEINVYVTTDKYDYNSKNFITSDYGGTGSTNYAKKLEAINNANYQKLSYSLPNSSGYYKTLGVSGVSKLESLIGLPSATYDKGSSSSKGLCDNFHCTSLNNTSQYFMGVMKGGSTDYGSYIGIFNCRIANSIGSCSYYIGMRTLLY